MRSSGQLHLGLKQAKHVHTPGLVHCCLEQQNTSAGNTAEGAKRKKKTKKHSTTASLRSAQFLPKSQISACFPSFALMSSSQVRALSFGKPPRVLFFSHFDYGQGTWLVFGSTGWIGGMLVRLLQAKNEKIHLATARLDDPHSVEL
jgi:hypothetical protein